MTKRHALIALFIAPIIVAAVLPLTTVNTGERVWAVLALLTMSGFLRLVTYTSSVADRRYWVYRLYSPLNVLRISTAISDKTLSRVIKATAVLDAAAGLVVLTLIRDTYPSIPLTLGIAAVCAVLFGYVCAPLLLVHVTDGSKQYRDLIDYVNDGFDLADDDDVFADRVSRIRVPGNAYDMEKLVSEVAHEVTIMRLVSQGK